MKTPSESAATVRIERDLEAAAAEPYDLIVVGGGIYGATLLLEAARRGLRALLLEKSDFGGATSWNSLRIVHGGLRYLQTLDLHRFRESVAERKWLLHTFPDLIRPLRCLMPLYGDGLRRPSVFRVALRVNDWLSRRRNEGAPEGAKLPPGEVLGVSETLALFPGVRRPGLQGGAVWHDAVMTSPQRVLIEILRTTCALGGISLNYVEARDLLVEDGSVAGVRAADVTTGVLIEFRAPVAVNCAGPWCAEVSRRFGRERRELFLPSLAVNVLLDVDPPSEAAVAVAPDYPGSRTYFVYPFRGRTLAGTYHAPWNGELGSPRPDEALLADFLKDLRSAIPGFKASEDRVLRVFSGLLPAAREKTAALAVRERIHDHAAGGGPAGLFSVSGVKFTTARLVAEKTLRAIARRHKRTLADAAPLVRPPPRRIPSGQEFFQLIRTDPTASERCLGELVAEEAVVQAEDLLLRRTDWQTDPRSPPEVAAWARHRLASGRAVFP